MSESKYIPWTARRIGETGFAGGFDVYAVRDSRGREIAYGITKYQAEVFAAAPELLEALEDAAHRVRWLLQFVSDQEPVEDELRKWDAAIAKATGAE